MSFPFVRLRRLLVVALFPLCFASPSRADSVDYSDIWWAAGGIEAGWGVNFAQSPGFIFATFFVFGPDKKPTWYVAAMVQTAEGRYSGSLSKATGSWFGAPWLALDATEQVVGEATFVADSPHRGTLTYRVDTTEVVKTIERIPLTPVSLAGTFLGGVVIKSSAGCTSGASTATYAYQYIVTQSASNLVTIQHITTDGVNDCNMAGNAVQYGKVMHIPTATYVCTSYGVNTTAQLYDLQRTSTGGLEGRWTASLGGNCTEDGKFTAAQQE